MRLSASSTARIRSLGHWKQRRAGDPWRSPNLGSLSPDRVSGSNEALCYATESGSSCAPLRYRSHAARRLPPHLTSATRCLVLLHIDSAMLRRPRAALQLHKLYGRRSLHDQGIWGYQAPLTPKRTEFTSEQLSNRAKNATLLRLVESYRVSGSLISLRMIRGLTVVMLSRDTGTELPSWTVGHPPALAHHIVTDFCPISPRPDEA